MNENLKSNSNRLFTPTPGVHSNPQSRYHSLQPHHHRSMKFRPFMRKFHPAVIFFRDIRNTFQPHPLVPFFRRHVTLPVPLYMSVKSVIHRNGKHFPGADHVQTHEAVCFPDMPCRPYRIVQKVPQQDGKVRSEERRGGKECL